MKKTHSPIAPFGLPPKEELKAPWWDFDFLADYDPAEIFKPVILQRKTNGMKGSVHIFSTHELHGIRSLFPTLVKKLGEPACISHEINSTPMYLWAWDEGVLRASTSEDSGSVACAVTDEKFLKWLMKEMVSYQVDFKTKSYIWMASKRPPNGLSFRRMGTNEIPLERKNYSPKVLQGYDRAVDDLKSSDPKGRIILLDGIPGGGKTYLLRGFIQEVRANFVVVNSKNYEDLMDPEFIESIHDCFEDQRDMPIVFVLEDADKLLQPRELGASLGGLSSALNMGDGLISSLMDVRIIATTNAPIETIDPAIVRAGRLSERIHIEKLDLDQTREVFKRLVPETEWVPSEPMVLADIYAKAREFGWKSLPKKEVVVREETKIIPGFLRKSTTPRTRRNFH